MNPLNVPEKPVSVPPMVSVIMNCYNSDKYLREAIDSVYAQTYSSWEIIFFDNASIDKSAEIAKSYDRRLRYFRNPNTVPLGQARNLAIANARGKYIAFLDCDDVWLSQKLEKQVEAAEKDDGIGLVYTDSHRIRSNGTRFSLFSYDHKPVNGQIPLDWFIEDCVISPFSSIMVRKDACDDIQGFSQDVTFSEEYEFYIKLAEKKYAVKYIHIPLTEYRWHENNWTWKRDECILEWIQLVDRFLERRPEFKTRFPKRVAKRYFFLNSRIAVFYLVNGNIQASLKYFWRSIVSAGFSPLLIGETLFLKLLVRQYKIISKRLKECNIKCE